MLQETRVRFNSSLRSILKRLVPAPIRHVGWQTYYRVRDHRFLLNQVVDLCKVVMVKAERIRWPVVRIVVCELARFVGDLALLLNQFPRLDVYQLTGSEGRVIFVGSPGGATVLHSLFFSKDEVKQQKIGRVALWTLPSQTQHWLSEGAALVVCELSRFYPWRLQANLKFSVPTWIKHVLPLPESLETMLVGSKFSDIRWALNRAGRQGFSYRFSQDKADFDHFYHRMYVPYVSARHGELVYVEPYEALWRWFTKGGLVLVTRDGEAVAGSLVLLAQDRCFGVDGGVLDADPALFKMRIYTVNIWMALQWAHSQGVTLLDMGGTRAWRSDGVFSYKRGWGAKVTRLYGFIRSNYTFLMQDPSPAWRDQVNRLGLIAEHKRKFYGIILPESAAELDEAVRQKLLQEMRDEGLSGLAIVSQNQISFCDSSN